jgi:hypothetical protein
MAGFTACSPDTFSSRGTGGNEPADGGGEGIVTPDAGDGVIPPDAGEPSGPIQVTGDPANADQVTVRVPGRYTLDFVKANVWLPTRLFDARAPNVNLGAPLDPGTSGGAPCGFMEPTQYLLGGWQSLCKVVTKSALTVEANLASVHLKASYAMPNVNGIAEYYAYASGRIAVTSTLSTAVQDTEIGHTSVNPAVLLQATDLAHGYAFTRTDAVGSNILVGTRVTTAEVLSDRVGNRYLHTGTKTPTALSYEVTLGLANAPGAELTARLADINNPGLVNVSGTNGETPYDNARGAYVLTPAGGTLTFAPSPAATRYAPVFVVKNWTAKSWELSRGSAVVANSEAPSSAEAVVGVQGSELIIVSLRDFATDVPTMDRLFTLRAITASSR